MGSPYLLDIRSSGTRTYVRVPQLTLWFEEPSRGLIFPPMPIVELLGSGEFEPWARPVDSWCAERATAPSERVLIVPTAAAPEGEDVFQRWAQMGIEH